MKQHIKKLSILFLLAALLASCDAEEMYLKEKNSNNGEPVIKTLSYKEAGETFNRLKNELKIEKHLKTPETSNLQARTIKDTLGFLIETDLIKQVTLGEYKSYTMKLVKEIEGNIFFNLTIEDKNGESSMFMTCYIPSSYWVNNKDEAFQGVIVSRRMNTLTQYQEPEILFDDIINSHFNYDLGTSPGGGGNYSLQNGSPYYPFDCNGYVIVSIKLVPYPCGCENHMPWECNSCPNSPAGYDEIPYYYCQEYPNLGGDNPDNPTNPSTGGPTSPNPDDTSITAMIKPEECKERIVGDLNRDCQLSPYETCLLGGNSQEVCDCVAAGGQLIDCKKDECVTTINTTFVESLSIEQKAWWEDNENASERNEIENFIANSGCSEESKEFAQEAIEAFKNGGEVDIDKEILYLINKPCQNQVVKDVLSISSPLTNLINVTFGANNKVNVKFSNTNIPNANAQTNPFYYGTASNFTISIAFDNTFLETSTDLGIVAVTLHELVHAQLLQLYIKGQLTSANSTQYNDLLNAFIAFYDNQVQDTFDVLDNEIHNAMEDFIVKIGNSLYNYANSKNIDVTLQYCIDLAWGTMSGYELFNEILTSSQQINCNNIFAYEQDNLSEAKGNPCN